jgi:Fur family peroxide stress response transcriptional regulator
MRYSKQRETILTALKNNPLHPTADCLYALLKKDNPLLSLGTVYRNLNRLADEGLIKKIKGLDNKEHFDHNTFEHCHIICDKCGRVEDIMMAPLISKNLKRLREATDFDIETCELILRGTCKYCK